MNILVHGSVLGYGGIAHYTREFTKLLSKHHNVKIRNFNLVDLYDWAGYTGPNILKSAKHLDEAHHSMLYHQTLYNDKGEFEDYPLSGYDDEFVPDVHIIMSEVNHYYHFQNYDKPVITYFFWESTNFPPDFIRALSSSNYIWVPSEWQKRMLINSGIDSDKISVIRAGIDSSKYYPIEKKNEKLRLLHIGTWGYRKSTYEIIKSFQEVFKDNEDVEFRISINNKLHYQEGPVETLEKFGLPLNKNIKLLGTLSEEDYMEEIKNADLYVSCSRGEGWNLPLLQSIFSGIPSIYSKCGAQLEFSGLNLGIPISADREYPAKRTLNIMGNSYGWESMLDYPDNNLYEPDFDHLKYEMKKFYKSFLEGGIGSYREKALADSLLSRDFFSLDSVESEACKALESSISFEFSQEKRETISQSEEDKKINFNQNQMSNIYYLIHSQSFGDTLASTPTLRYLSKSHRKKINVVTYNKHIFKNNPYVSSLLSFEDYNNLSLSGIIKYESFTFAGGKDNNGIEKKFSHIDARQIHAMDLGFQLPNEDLEYDYYPDPFSLGVELPERYVVLHVTTNWANRTWDYNNWVSLIKWLKENNIYTVLVGAGYKEEIHYSIGDKPLSKDCPMFDDYYGLDLTNKGSMGDMWWIINGADCLVTMDSGPLHLASCTDTHIIQLGSAINPAFKRFYRKGDWKYKYHFLGGSCQLFCNTNLFYNVQVWGDINSVPPLPNCLENKPTFECHPSVDKVINKINEIVGESENSKYISFIEILPSDDKNKINYNFTKTSEDIVTIVVLDVETGLTRDVKEEKCKKLEEGYYWWAPMPSRLENLGDLDLVFYLNGEYSGRKRLHFEGLNKLEIKGEKVEFEYSRKTDYGTFWEIFVNKEYDRSEVCKVSEGDVVLDIGANCGFFSLYSLNLGASKIYSVEPVKDSYDKIVKLSKKFTEIVPINKAISEVDGKIDMFTGGDVSATNCVVHYGEKFDKRSGIVSVDSININSLLESIDVKINLMKVDCEGSEYELFKTISDENLKMIDKFIIETHSSEINDFICNSLENNGFEVEKFGDNLLFSININ